MLRLRDILFLIYANATGKDQQVIHEDCERNKWLDPEEMLEYGLIDKILSLLPTNN
jgi:ATP-dependent Clp protease protease subunit